MANEEYLTDPIVTEADDNVERLALVKKDPADTYSTGGTIVCVFVKAYEGYMYDTRQNDSGYEMINVPDDCTIPTGPNPHGWVKQDKTGIIVNTNA